MFVAGTCYLGLPASRGLGLRVLGLLEASRGGLVSMAKKMESTALFRA